MTKLTENERKALNNACARLRETNLGTKIGNIEDFLDIDILKTDANTVSKAIDELFDKWANPLLNITVPPPGFFTLAGDAEGNLWCYCNDETNPPIFEHDETTGDLYLNIASEDGANSYQVHVGNYIAVKHLNDYYKKTEIDSKLGGKSNVGHNHDERYYTETEIDAKVNNINSQINSLIGFTATIVNSLPSTGEVGVMYLKLNTSASVEGNIYDEYIWVNNKFEKIGSTETTVDLSGYVTQTEMNTQLANKANVNHSHTSDSIDLDQDSDDGMWVYEYGINRQSSVNGFVYDHDKKLENIDDGANKTVVDSSLSSSSINPVQNKIVTNALNGKANNSHSHSISNITDLQSSLDGKTNINTRDFSFFLSDVILPEGSSIADKSITHSHVHDTIQIPYKQSTQEGYRTDTFNLENFDLFLSWSPNSLGTNSNIQFILLNPETNEKISVVCTPQQGRTWVDIVCDGGTNRTYDQKGTYGNVAGKYFGLIFKVRHDKLSYVLCDDSQTINTANKSRGAEINPNRWRLITKAGAWSSGTSMSYNVSGVKMKIGV
ncbi:MULTISPECIES: hypothetical protein [Methanobrevibacter]|jgi:hypothetical protein|uniref:Uncharacterized protein n=2 Tax=root TaxID=1 RepID=A5UNW5_METS3|nr:MULTISPECIES: hypothetical protein [Methanobrevibacter]ABQ87893.1 hypothetical protein Msm_1688 [Methanobrevibacter smithii ATCC 35061]